MSQPRWNYGSGVADGRPLPLNLSPEEREWLRGNDAQAGKENARLTPVQPGTRAATFEELEKLGFPVANPK